MIVVGMAAGAGLGLGLFLVARGLLAGPPPLATALRQLTAPPDEHGDGRDESRKARRRFARRLAASLEGVGVDVRGLESNLRVAGRDLEQHLLHKLATATVGLTLPPVLALIARTGGLAVPAALPTVSALGLAVGGFLLPDLKLRSLAEQRRRAFRFALSSYLDLVRVILAAGVGMETALLDAAEAGHGWALTELRAALVRCHITGESPWVAFRRLGEDLDVSELREVAASLGLAGSQGAKARASLEARAQAMRTRHLADMEAQAEAATERMSVPSVVLVVGFILFVGFPAVHEILGF